MGRVCAPALTFLFFINRLRRPLAQGRTMIASPLSHCGAGFARAVQESPAAAACGGAASAPRKQNRYVWASITGAGWLWGATQGRRLAGAGDTRRRAAPGA